MIDELEQFGIFAEEMTAGVAAGLDGIFLIIAVNGFFHAFEEQTGFVGGEEFVPIGTPDDFDDVPAGALKGGFEFLDNFAIAADGSVEALEIAVDDPNQVVEIFAGGQGEG